MFRGLLLLILWVVFLPCVARSAVVYQNYMGHTIHRAGNSNVYMSGSGRFYYKSSVGIVGEIRVIHYKDLRYKYHPYRYNYAYRNMLLDRYQVRRDYWAYRQKAQHSVQKYRASLPAPYNRHPYNR